MLLYQSDYDTVNKEQILNPFFELASFKPELFTSGLVGGRQKIKESPLSLGMKQSVTSSSLGRAKEGINFKIMIKTKLKIIEKLTNWTF